MSLTDNSLVRKSESQDNQDDQERIKAPDSWYGARHTQILLMFGMLSIGYSMRVNLSVGIRAMTDPDASPNPDVPTYDWENTSTILSSFFWGYIVLQVVAGSLAQKYGPKWFLVCAMGVNCLACLLTPVVADSFGSTGVIVCRVFQGLSQGFFFPSVHGVLGKWAPLKERSLLGAFAYAGPPFGTIVGMSITGIIAESWVGWPLAFYLFGGVGLVWIVIWYFIGYNSPEHHPTISKTEQLYIQASLDTKKEKKKLMVPWIKIATSLPMWAVFVGHAGQNWGFTTLLTEIPTYLNKVIGFNLETNGFLSATPYLVQFIFSIMVGPISDWLINKKFISRGTSRKLFNSIGTIIPGIALIILGFIPKENVAISVTLLIVAVGINAGVFAGFQVNHVDLSPNYSGILMGITNGFSSIFSILGPLAVQGLVPDARQTEQLLWRTVFIIAGCVYILTDLFYVIFASGVVQSWNYYGLEEEHKTDKEENNNKNLEKI